MKRKPIRIDWDALEEAFARSADDVPEHLDLVTGHVVLEGEGEEDEYDDDEDHFDPRGTVAATRDPMRLPVERADTATKLRWLEAFLEGATGLDGGVVDELRTAMVGADPARRLSQIFNANAAERDAWYGYKVVRLRERIGRWLAENGVEPIDPPPWRD